MDREFVGDVDGVAIEDSRETALILDHAAPITGRPGRAARPRLAQHLVDRPRLLARLEARAPLTVLRAPVGYGKTTLVAQWLRRRDPDRETVGWVHVGPGCTDPQDFWVAVIDALTDVGVPMPPLSQHRSPQALAERMLRTHADPLVLVLDGVDAVSGPTIDERLVDLVWNAPALRIVACLRRHDTFSPDRLADLETIEITAQDLLFTADETAELLSHYEVSLPADAAEALHADTGGWPEPTRLFAMTLRDRPLRHLNDVRETVGAIAVDYLTRRLMPEVCSPEQAEFALRTSVPDEFTADLAELLTAGDPTGHLAWLEGHGMLLADTIDGEPVYRWPRAVRVALLDELARRHPEEVADLHGRTARRALRRGQVGTALHHAVTAADWPLVLEVINAGWRELFLTSYHELQHAIVATPFDVISASTRALAVRDIVLRNPDDRILTLAKLPANAIELVELGRGEHIRDVIEIGLAVLVAVRWRGLFDHAREYGDRLLQVATAAREAWPSQVVDLLPNAHLQVGHTRLLADDLPGAMASLERAYEWASDSAFDYVEPAAASALALAHAIAGETRPAATWLERYAAAPPPSTWLGARIQATAGDAERLVALDRLVLDRDGDARDPLSADFLAKEFVAYAVYAQAQRALHTGAMFEALALIDRVRATHQAWLGAGAAARPLLAAAEADLLIGLGKGNQAHTILHGPDSDHPLLRVGQARLALLSGNTAAAVRLSSDTAWSRAAMARSRLEMLLIRAVAAYRAGDRNMAAEALHRAAGEATAAGSLRAFATVPRPELQAIAVAVPDAAALLAEPALAATTDLYPPEVQIIELTEREQRVLEKLAGGLTLQRAADSLVVSYNTVKSQQRSLYRKLSVDSRAEAIARARQWGLL